ncbi:hypothetical protein B484DRAFT_247696 [Ochromonadaceae sp. CCMP2298]|nr:hypothetical protein B484DRAFT_247696 [Ochromonadaceae sp. CCMP2298]
MSSDTTVVYQNHPQNALGGVNREDSFDSLDSVVSLVSMDTEGDSGKGGSGDSGDFRVSGDSARHNPTPAYPLAPPPPAHRPPTALSLSQDPKGSVGSGNMGTIRGNLGTVRNLGTDPKDVMVVMQRRLEALGRRKHVARLLVRVIEIILIVRA